MKTLRLIILVFLTTVFFTCEKKEQISNDIAKVEKVPTAVLERLELRYMDMKQIKESFESRNKIIYREFTEKLAQHPNLKNQTYLKQMKELLISTRQMNLKIDRIIFALIDRVGKGYSEYHRIKKPEEIQQVEKLMVTEDSLGYRVKSLLNKHTDWLYEKAKEWGVYSPFPRYIALDSPENPAFMYEENLDIKGENFAESNFRNTPVVLALIILVEKQIEVLYYEQIMFTMLENYYCIE